MRLATASLGGRLADDGQLIDDARLVTAVARMMLPDMARESLRAVGVSNATGTLETFTDQRSGESFDVVAARAVINASGVWAGQVDRFIICNEVKSAQHIGRWTYKGVAHIPSPR